MTILERLATVKTGTVAGLIEHQKQQAISTQDQPRDDGAAKATGRSPVAWGNDPSWDNWKQKTPAWKKKKVYFRNKGK